MALRNKLIFSVIAVLLLLAGVSTTVSVLAASSNNLPNGNSALVVDDETEPAVETGEDDALTGVVTVLTSDEAAQIALAANPGATVLSVTLEDENGVIVFAVELQQGATDLDVKVDANLGTILATDNQGFDNDDLDNDNVQHESDNEDSGDHED